MECNFNPQKRIYNPHLHFIVPNKEIADLLISEWCILWTKVFVNPDAQKATKIWDKENALVEIVKYSTKIFTDPNMAKKGKATAPPYIYLAALDVIVEALKGHRIFDRFGFNLPKKEKQKKLLTLLPEYKELIYNTKKFDWVETSEAEVLTGYTPPSQLMAILDFNVNTFTALKPFEMMKEMSNKYDFNDYFYYHFCKKHDIPVVTHDKDFKFNDIQVFTNNKSLLN